MEKKGNLLIVDDEPILLMTLKFNLREFADNIYEAENGLVALEQIKKHEIHCVLCDINMPVMNGIELIKNVRALNLNTPFIFYTGHGYHELMIQASKYDAFEFLSKPDLANLEEAISIGLQKGTGNPNAEVKFRSEYKKFLNG